MNKIVNLGLVGSVLLLALAGNAQALSAPSADGGRTLIPDCEFGGTIDPENYHVSISGVPPTVSINPGATAWIYCYEDSAEQLMASQMSTSGAVLIPECKFGGEIDLDDFYVEISNIPPTIHYDPGVDAWIRCYRDFVNGLASAASANAALADLSFPPECKFGGTIDPENYHVSISGVPPTVTVYPGATAWVRCTLAYLAQFAATQMASSSAAGIPKCEFSGEIDLDEFYVEISHIPPTVHYDPGVDYTIRCYMDYLAQFVGTTTPAAL